jgi:DNA-binding GntR family transcriptional regulator
MAMTIETEIFEPIDTSNLREHIEERIRNAILYGALRSGEHIVESALAEQLRVSRAPVREALSALERDGLITLIPRRGYFVVEFSPSDIEEVYGLRSILETGALPRVIESLTPEDIADFQLVIDQFSQAVQDGQARSKIVNLDFEFHGLICRKANNGRLFSTWQSMRHQTWLLMGVTSQTEYDYLEQPVVLHQRILNAIGYKDTELAVSLLREHILDGQKRALASLKTADEINQ